MCNTTEFITVLNKRRTFAIISHPDAGKTTLTERLLLFGGAVKGRKSQRHATSDWMELERQRGISVTSSVMQFPYRDRIAFLRVCSGKYTPGMKAFHVRLGREVRIPDALAFMAAERERTVEAYPGDIIGIHNHGTVRIGDTFSEGEPLRFTGIPDFAPELFRRARLRDPLKMKQLTKGLGQLCEEGATQLFKPLNSNDPILGAVGVSRFDVAAYRLKAEYNVDCLFEAVNVATARWVSCDDPERFEEFRDRCHDNLALDHHGELVYIAPTRVNLQMTQERWPEVRFNAIREHH